MRRIALALFALIAFALPSVANAQTAQVAYISADGKKVFVSEANPLPTSGPAGVPGASAANQTATQANAGSDATKATAVQGITGGKPVPVSGTVTSQIAGNSLCHIATATTTNCKSGAGVLHTLSVNNLGTVASLTTVYDNTAGSGTVIAIINTLAGQTSYLYDISFATGLTIVTTGTVAPDITVSYR